MVPRLIPVTQYAGRVSRAAADAIDGRLRRHGYVRPAERRLAGEGDRLLLDPVEAGLAKASMRGDGYGRIAAYVQLEGPAVAQEGIEACLRALQARHPYLRRAVARTPLGLALVPEDGPLPTVEHELAEDMCVEDLWKEIERRPLRIGEVLGRVHVIRFATAPRRTDLIVELEHVICDGASLTRFGCELVEQLSVYAETGAPRRSEPLHLTASLNARCTRRMGGRATALARMAQRIARSAWRFRELRPSGLARNSAHRYDQCSTHILRAALSAEESEGLFQAARRHNVSLMSVLSSAFALSIGTRLATTEGGERDRRLLLSVTSSLRHRYVDPVGTHQLGVHISGVDPSLVFSGAVLGRQSPSDLWEAARELRAQLREAMAPGQDAHWLLAYATGAAITLQLRVPQVDLCSLLMTDSAPFATPERIGVYRLRDARPLNNGRAHSYPYVIVSKSPQGLLLSLFAPVPAFAVEDLEAVLQGATERLRTALRAEPSLGQTRTSKAS